MVVSWDGHYPQPLANKVAAFQNFVPHSLRVTGKIGQIPPQRLPPTTVQPLKPTRQAEAPRVPQHYFSPERGGAKPVDFSPNRGGGIRDYSYVAPVVLADDAWRSAAFLSPDAPPPAADAVPTAYDLASRLEHEARVSAIRRELETARIHMSTLEARRARLLQVRPWRPPHTTPGPAPSCPPSHSTRAGAARAGRGGVRGAGGGGVL